MDEELQRRIHDPVPPLYFVLAESQVRANEFARDRGWPVDRVLAMTSTLHFEAWGAGSFWVDRSASQLSDLPKVLAIAFARGWKEAGR
jgi:hypothetical protein